MVKGARTMIFCNTTESCNFVYWSLSDKGYKVSEMSGVMPFKKRRESFANFKSGRTDVLVCTNLASRGLDLPEVKHVIQYDFPYTVADYIHRVGRTARGGDAGRVTTLFSNRNLPMVKKIKEAARAGTPIDVKYATKNIRRILALELKRKQLQAFKNPKLKIGGRRRLGLPPKRNVASPRTKEALKQLHFKLKAIQEVKRLRNKGILKQDEYLPRRPHPTIEASDAQEFTKMVRGKDGLLQLLPQRRSAAKLSGKHGDTRGSGRHTDRRGRPNGRQRGKGRGYEDESTTQPLAGAPTYEQEQSQKKQKTRRTYF
eukprot:GDKI01034595.1.p1 GENE.GDKI01034595.1~~GDKI01034595.1.p1  ORF type:complete len:347 (-),score=63.66 GDKI01034595.1:185-1126(-)